jgi:hypothetical protein
MDIDAALCSGCQGLLCGQVDECDNLFPCIGGTIEIRGCCSDADCADLTPFCGQYIGVNNVCVSSDDV